MLHRHKMYSQEKGGSESFALKCWIREYLENEEIRAQKIFNA